MIRAPTRINGGYRMHKTPLALPLALGLIAGVRSASAPATLSAVLASGSAPHADDPLVALALRLRPLLLTMAGGELAGDKLPAMPNRTSPPALLGRIGLGALSGGLAARAFGQPMILAAGVAGAAALASTFASFHLRTLLSESLGLPSAAAGLVEDAVLLAAAALVVRAQQANS
jgi:uncharacterized membrane protein